MEMTQQKKRKMLGKLTNEIHNNRIAMSMMMMTENKNCLKLAVVIRLNGFYAFILFLIVPSAY